MQITTNMHSMYHANAALNITTDLLVAALPVRQLWKLQIAMRQKIALLLILTLGWLYVHLFNTLSDGCILMNIQCRHNLDHPTLFPRSCCQTSDRPDVVQRPSSILVSHGSQPRDCMRFYASTQAPCRQDHSHVWKSIRHKTLE
jgi:hypothetical protein